MATRQTLLFAGALFAGAIAAPLSAGGQDSAAARAAQGIQVDFQDVDVKIVINALAEAAALNVSYNEIPARKTTLRLRQPVDRANIPALLRSLALANGLTYSEEGGIIRIAAPAAGAPPSAAQTPQDSILRDIRLFVHPLKHVKAARMASTLQAIFGGRAAATSSGLSQAPLSQQLRGQAIAPFGADTSSRLAAPAPGGAQVLRAQLRGEVQIVPDEISNAIVVRAIPADFETIQQAMDAMDLRPLQALIEVVIAEVRTSDNREVGVTGSVSARNGANPPNTRSATQQSAAATDFVARLTQNSEKLTVDLALAALQSRGTVRVLSRPVLLAQNNQEARILVGEQRPFVQVFRSLPTDQAVRDQVIQYRDVATTLTLIPTINADGYVNLQVQQEVSSATAETQFGAPVISTREASTHLFVKDGQTAVMGGLVGAQNDRTRSGVPFLSQIPLIGALFGTHVERTSTSEIFLFLTPHVIKTDDDAARMRDALRRSGSDSTGLAPAERPIIRPPR